MKNVFLGQDGIPPEGAKFLWSFAIWGIEIRFVIQILRLVGELFGGEGQREYSFMFSLVTRQK